VLIRDGTVGILLLRSNLRNFDGVSVNLLKAIDFLAGTTYYLAALSSGELYDQSERRIS
jgi:hypothetical protein